eukprot:scpid32913/ scgid6063/ Fibropellin-1; Epidermal growth factor-related protein 1; Fibropellin-I; SpEGF I; UEGF-1
MQAVNCQTLSWLLSVIALVQSQEQPTLPVFCPDTLQLENGIALLGAVSNPGDLVEWVCNANYDMIGDNTAQCQLDGTWSQPIPECRPFQCPQPVMIPDGIVIVAERPVVGDRATYECDSGFEIGTGGPDIFCQLRGRETFWPNPPICENINECLSSPSASPCRNGGTCTDLISTYTCECPGEWTGQNCEIPRICSRPPPVENARTIFNPLLIVVGGKASYECVAGYELEQIDNTITCLLLENGETSWSRPLPSCREIDECALHPCLHGGTCHDFLNAHNCTCPFSYEGTHCEIVLECADPPEINNGGVTNLGIPPFLLETQVHYECADGFRRFGESNLTCVRIRDRQPEWSNSPPLCREINECAPRPCLNGGTCLDQVNNYTCICLFSYTGVNCETVLECSPPPTIDNGVVTSPERPILLGSSASYECDAGFSLAGRSDIPCILVGISPEWLYPPPECNDINECEPNPCLNGGQCQDLVNDFVCRCPPGYTGKNCETDIDDCAPNNPCLNGGSCVDLTPGYTCVCAPGFTGDDCRDSIVCPLPPRVTNGQTSWTSTTYQSVVTWTCNPDYTLVGADTAVCSGDATWSRPPPTCEVECLATIPDDFLEDSHAVSRAYGAPDCGKVAADIIVALDGSSSMKPAPRSWVHELIERVDMELKERGIGLSRGLPNHFTLVGFGRLHWKWQTGPLASPHVITDAAGEMVYGIDGFKDACKKLETFGSLEDGYLAMKFALQNITDEQSKRQLIRVKQDNVAPIVILITDEDRDTHKGGESLTRSHIKRIMRKSGAQMECIVDNKFQHDGMTGFGMDATGMLYTDNGRSGEYEKVDPGQSHRLFLHTTYRQTRRDYTSVALELGGAAWDLKQLFMGDQLQPHHVQAFADRTAEIVEHKVHKCCSCQCATLNGGDYLRCSAELTPGTCKRRRPPTIFRTQRGR